jgi:lipopolysaccharide export system permease protein
MKKIDWYIFKRYLITFTAMLFMFIPIGIIIDVSEKVNRMIENKVAFMPKKSTPKRPLLVFGFTIFYSLTLVFIKFLLFILLFHHLEFI